MHSHMHSKLLFVIGSAKRGTSSKFSFLIITHQNESNFKLIA